MSEPQITRILGMGRISVLVVGDSSEGRSGSWMGCAYEVR